MNTCCKLSALTALALLGVFPLRVRAADQEEHGFLHCVHKDADGTEAKYIVFVPYDYKGDQPVPTILFLHGAGETGTDGEKQAAVGLGAAIKKDVKAFHFLAIFPQSQKRTWQAGSPDADRALAILDEVSKKYKVDPDRLYLTGLSMGGYGTWSLAAKYPDRWTAIAPICGGVGRGGSTPEAIAEKVKDLPCWCFHGGADKTVPVAQSRALMKALWDVGGHPNYTEYPGVGHNSWDKAYATADLYEWLMKHQKKSAAPESKP